MKQWMTISTSVAAGILLAALVLFVLLSTFASFRMMWLNNPMGGTQGMMNMQGMSGMMNGMSSMGNMNQMMQHMNGMMGGSHP